MLICAALAVVSLSGCAELNADVHVTNPAGALPGARTYAIARSPSQTDSTLHPAYGGVLRGTLANYGFSEAEMPQARYVLSIAYDTRPAGVGVNTASCADATCPSAAPAASEAPFSLFGGQQFRHSLTLRFFERASGQEVYKVSASRSDRDADPLHAMPVLVKSALAKFPFTPPADWRVKLRAGEASGEPVVVSVKPQ
jgi:Domain of unknown function (DUF4136)